MPAGGQKKIGRRVAGVTVLLLASIVLLMGRIGWVQFVQGSQLTDKIQDQLVENKTLQSPRGTIYDRNHRELAISIMTKSLYADPAMVDDPEAVVELLSPILKMDPETIRKRIKQDNRFVWIERMLEPETVKAIQDGIKSRRINGLHFVSESKRYYPNNALAAQVLGFVGTDDVGLDGVELVTDAESKGKLAKHSVVTDNRGLPIFKSVFEFMPTSQGKNVYLTIDSTIQFITEKAMDKAMAISKPQSMTVIVMNPRTGDILAMANRPTYDPNHFYRFSERQWKNRAVSLVYEPGSTFKPIVAAAALQMGVVTPDEVFIDNGYVTVSGRRIQNSDDQIYGRIRLLDILKNSINTGMVQVGMRVGAEQLTNYAKIFGFGATTDVDLPGEERGILFNWRDMRASDLATMSIGQSIAVTPLQLITAISAIANDGVLMRPHIIKEIQNSDGSVYKKNSAVEVRRAVSAETAEQVKLMMEAVVANGGGKAASVKGYRVAGKTGTAQKLKEDGSGYESGHYISSFVGFAPVEDPQIIVLVVIDDPSQGFYYGGQIAAPVAGEILGHTLRYLDIKPHIMNTEYQVTLPPSVHQKKAQTPPGYVQVPDLRGKSIRQVSEELDALGLKGTFAGNGLAVRQSVDANTLVERGCEITVYFAT